jgi:radical SAM protein with 4Fe4S-binding SPASM domain
MANGHGLYSAVWNVTSKCNFTCKHCYVPPPDHRDLSFDEAKDLLNQLAELGAEELHLSGGEPLARDDLFDIIREATDIGFHVDTITNGWYVNKENARKFRESGADHVSVSTDGIGKTHDDFRNKPGSFERCVKAIKILRDEGVEVYVSPTISKLNFDELPDLFFLTESLGANFSTKVLVPIGEAKILDKYTLSPEEQKKFYEFIFAKKADNGMDIVTTCSPYSVLFTKKHVPKDDSRIHGGCTGGIDLLCIAADGRIMPCSRLQTTLGNVREDRLMDVWYSSEILATLRDRDNLKGKCGRCAYKNWCGGCRAMALAKLGDHLAGDPTCWYSA